MRVAAEDRGLSRAGSRSVRLAAFIAILLWMVLAPLYRQVLGGENRLVPHWVMFSDVSRDVVAATFTQRLPDGSERPLDRFALLGYQSPRSAPSELRRIRGMNGTHEVARRLCDALGHGADVRVHSRVGTREGWRPGYSGEQNLCEIALPEDGEAAR